MKVNINGSFSTFRRITISGSDNPITDIIKASAVPSEAPFSISTETIGTIPAALEYSECRSKWKEELNTRLICPLRRPYILQEHIREHRHRQGYPKPHISKLCRQFLSQHHTRA